MPNPAQSDIAYQPAQKGFSYTTSAPTPEAPAPESKKTNPFIILGLEILLLIVAFFIFLSVLNYFNIISLPNISPSLFGWLPRNQSLSLVIKSDLPVPPAPIDTTTSIPRIKATSGQENLTFEAEIFRTGKNAIQVKYAGELYGLELTDKTVCNKTAVDVAQQATTSPVLVPLPILCSDLLQNTINRKTVIDFSIIKGSNIINTITLE